MKPSILPPLMSLFAAAFVCGPPWLMSSVVNHGRVHPWLTSGFGTQTFGVPSASIGIPSAPGKVPKYWSKERFSCITMTMCWSLPPLGSVVLVARSGDPDGDPEAAPDRVAMDGASLVHAPSAIAAIVVATRSVRRIDTTADISGGSPSGRGVHEHSDRRARNDSGRSVAT